MRKKQRKKCKIEKCDDQIRSVHSEFCEKHYYRFRRTGTTDKRLSRKTITSHGYVKIWDSESHQMEYEHRKVLFESIGDGPFKCHWCKKVVTKKTMHTDHLDEDKKNNDPENVVPSCAICNQARGRHKMVSIMQDRGANLTLGNEMMPLIKWAKRIGISRFSLKWRLRNWSLERALTEPRGNTGPKGGDA